MSDHYMFIDGEPEIEKCPECGFDSLCVFTLTAMNDEGVRSMESTIRKCIQCHGEDEDA